MKYYQEITLLPDSEVNLGFLWHKVFQQIHIALADSKLADGTSAIAVSFPEYHLDKNKQARFPLGKKLRLFADSQMQLNDFDAQGRLCRLLDYCHIKTIKPVPENIRQYVCFKRKQFKSNLMREATRRAKYKNEPLEKALEHFQNYQTECKLPYINMISLSMKEFPDASRNFKLFIEQEILNKPREGQFNCYGLSKTATVPEF